MSNVLYQDLAMLPSYFQAVESYARTQRLRELDTFVILQYRAQNGNSCIKIYENKQSIPVNEGLQRINIKYDLRIHSSEWKYDYQFADLILRKLDSLYLQETI